MTRVVLAHLPPQTPGVASPLSRKLGLLARRLVEEKATALIVAPSSQGRWAAEALAQRLKVSPEVGTELARSPQEWLARVAECYPDGTVALAAGLDEACRVLWAGLGADGIYSQVFALEPYAVSIIAIGGGRQQVCVINDRCHLRGRRDRS
ncbi:MAG: hypothetical protein HY683_07370 [Chloroflexi bacterium]|nr:hypothetical protein [Chloroflexota bacterium]